MPIIYNKSNKQYSEKHMNSVDNSVSTYMEDKTTWKICKMFINLYAQYTFQISDIKFVEEKAEHFE